MTGRFGFACEKRPATGARGMVVSNHPRASGAGAQMLLAGGNAVDAAVATLFALTVVEPMMVGVLGGGVAHVRLASGAHVIVDGLSTAPGAAVADMYRPVSDRLPDYQEVEGRANARGALAVAVPGALAAWCHTLARYGTMGLGEVMGPAIGLAEAGFVVTPYLQTCVGDCAADLAGDADLAGLFLPGGAPVSAGSRLVRGDYAATLRLIAADGAGALYGGALGAALAGSMRDWDGLITEADLLGYAVREREAVRSGYRGFEVVGPPPPASSGVHIGQMLNLLEGFDVGVMGFGSVGLVHLLAEVMKCAFADRGAATADPDFIDVPVERLMSKRYADSRRGEIDMGRARDWAPGVELASGESADTTHVTVADADGMVVSSTQTINGLFGAAVAVPGTGMICNNYMFNFDPHPGRALSIAGGKRVFTSMAPMMVERDGRLAFALGLPGALRIFPSALQAIVNVIDHGMSLQEAVEAPRVFTQGHVLEVEEGLFGSVAAGLEALGHAVVSSPRVAGGMNAIGVGGNGMLTGSACWRADGTAVGIGGGLARAGVKFVI